jgi:hypothetical protein
MLVLLMGGIYDVRHLDGFMLHCILAKLHGDKYRRSSNTKAFPQESKWL